MPLLWIDLETTELDPEEGYILEVAHCVTDDRALPIPGVFSGIIHNVVFPTHYATERLELDPYVVGMHKASGLYADVHLAAEGRKWAPLLSQAEDTIIETLIEAGKHVEVTERYKWTIAGSGISFDRSFIEIHMPRLFQHLGYRIVDVSQQRSFFIERLGLHLYDNSAGSTHRADADIQDHLTEYRTYTVATAKAFGISIPLMDFMDASVPPLEPWGKELLNSGKVNHVDC